MDRQDSGVIEVFRDIIKRIVNHDDEVELRAIESAATTIIEIRVNPRDLGLLIGKRGRHADALRTLAVAMGGRVEHHYIISIIGQNEQGKEVAHGQHNDD